MTRNFQFKASCIGAFNIGKPLFDVPPERGAGIYSKASAFASIHSVISCKSESCVNGFVSVTRR